MLERWCHNIRHISTTDPPEPSCCYSLVVHGSGQTIMDMVAILAIVSVKGRLNVSRCLHLGLDRTVKEEFVSEGVIVVSSVMRPGCQDISVDARSNGVLRLTLWIPI
jgi:hypothetical protein